MIGLPCRAKSRTKPHTDPEMIRIPLLLALAPMMPALAQGTFIVDLANGPGTNFTQIAAAVSAVPSGSILHVRTGNYAAVDINGKALTILAEMPVTLPQLTVRNTGVAQRVMIHGLTTNFGSMEVLNAAGLVMLEGIDGMTTLRVSTSAQVLVRDSTFSFPLFGNTAPTTARIDGGSHVVFESCTLMGKWGENLFGNLIPPSPALDVGLDGTTCRVHLASCIVSGGWGGYYGTLWLQTPYAGAPGIRLDGDSEVRVSGDATHWLGQGNGPVVGFAITGTGSARIDPAVIVDPPLTSNATLTVTRPELANLTCTGGALGSPVAISFHGTDGVLYAIAASYPGTPLPWFGEPDPLWLSPGTTIVQTFGVATANPLQLQWPIPSQAAIAGTTLFWQAVELPPAGGLPLSNPTAVMIR